MKRNLRTPRGGMIVALCVAITAVWLLAVYGTYEESKREKYDVHITPGAVTYGTHSTATVPTVMTTTRHAVPMVSGGAVRSYAHYGHASMPSATSTGKGLYATSSASVHTIGSGGGASGGGIASSTGVSSSRGITYGGGSVSIPTLALAAPATSSRTRTTTDLAEQTYYGIGPRRVKPTGAGADQEWRYGGNPGDDPDDWWWYDDYDEEWYQVTDDDMRPANDGTGNYWKYSGGTWTYVDDHGNPIAPTPLGATPWMLMMLLAGAYALCRYYILDNKSK